MSRKSENILQLVTAKSQDDDLSDILQSLTAKSENIVNALRAQSPIRLSWTHYRIILQESNKEARDWYEQEAAREMWGTRTLQRNVSSQYYHRLLQSQNKDAVRGEMKQLTAPLQDKLEYGQMDMYVRMYDEMMLPQGHNPTIGLILCADTDDDVAHYSVLNGSDQLFAAKYLTYMPSRADLRREIEQQKEFFLLQHKGENND